jgi:hypothetical protein
LSLTPELVEYINKLMRADLFEWRNFLFDKLLLSTKLVALGLLLEGPELTWDMFSLFRQWRFKTRFHFSVPEGHPSAGVKVAAFVGWILIAVGVAGEWYLETMIESADAGIQSAISVELANTENQTSLLNLRASINSLESELFRLDSEKLRRDSERLRKEAESERLARVKIEASVAWRRLDSKQARDIGTQLTRFGEPPRFAGLSFNTGDTEASSFASELAEALRIGGIKVGSPSPMTLLSGPGRFDEPIAKPQTGVLVTPSRDSIAKDTAATLVKALAAKGFDATLQPSLDTSPKQPRTVFIFVMPRPEGPQGEYKLQAERDVKAKDKTKTSK